jgi:hypothetical protein
MHNPLEVTFHDTGDYPRIEELIQEKFDKLNASSLDITKCHIIVDQESKHHQSGNSLCVRLDLKAANFEDVIINEKCTEDEVSVKQAVNKVFKRGQVLVREAAKRIQDKQRSAGENISFEAEDVDDDDEDVLTEVE